MKTFTTAVALASVVPAIMSMTINTPASVVQCQPQLLTWSDGAPPYYLSIIPGGQPAAAPLKTFDTQTGNSLTWKVDQRGGAIITLSVKDSTGAVAYSDVVTVQQGPDSSCLNGSGGPPAAAQDVSVNTANVATPSSVSGPVTGSGATRPTGSAPGINATRAASVASLPSSATLSVSRTTTAASRPAATSSSGAESSLIGNSYGLVGAVGFFGAMFL